MSKHHFVREPTKSRLLKGIQSWPKKMIGRILLFSVAIALLLKLTYFGSERRIPEGTFYDFSAKDALGQLVEMRQFEGKVVVVVNVASE